MLKGATLAKDLIDLGPEALINLLRLLNELLAPDGFDDSARLLIIVLNYQLPLLCRTLPSRRGLIDYCRLQERVLLVALVLVSWR